MTYTKKKHCPQNENFRHVNSSWVVQLRFHRSCGEMPFKRHQIRRTKTEDSLQTGNLVPSGVLMGLSVLQIITPEYVRKK